MSKKPEKVFAIGLPKTGTNSITNVFTDLGFKTKHYIAHNFEEKSSKYDFISDVLASIRFEWLDRAYPGSKFILTVRELNSWLDSCRNHFKREAGGIMGKVREELFGVNVWDEELFRETYNRHFRNVRTYFQGRDNLLILDILGGDKPDRMEDFLGFDVNVGSFPKKNVRSYNWKSAYLNNILMSRREVAMIRRYLNPTNTMLEWGAGGSTVYFPLFVKKYYSIEHDSRWYDKVKPQILYNVSMFLEDIHCQSNHKCLKRENCEEYVEKVNELDTEFDRVLIDGRGRRFCAEEVLPYLHNDSLVFIHDFWNRKRYHSVLEHYEVVDAIKNGQSLVVLRPK